MTREEFEHVIRAAAAVVGDELVVVGSQAILAEHPDASDALLQSMELDLYPLSDPERSTEIDGALGDGSGFHAAFEYYAHGVGPESIVAPAGWEQRLHKVEVPLAGRRRGKAVAWCLSPHDLVLAKLAAGRPHDFAFVRAAVEFEYVDPQQLRLGVELMPMSHREIVTGRLEQLLADVAGSGD